MPKPSTEPSTETWPSDTELGDEEYDWPSAPVERAQGQPLPWLDWKYSILFPVAILLTLATVLWQVVNTAEQIELSVTDNVSGAPIGGAQVAVGGQTLIAGEDGSVSFDRPEDIVDIRVSADGYISMSGQITESTGREQSVALQPSTLTGRLTDQVSGEPIGAVTITVLDAAGRDVGSTTTDETGTYRFSDVPEGASIRIEAGAYGTVTQQVNRQTQLDVPMALTQASGIVLDDAGEPLQGAIVRSGDATSVSGGDGSFTLDGVADGDEVAISMAGFESRTANIASGEIETVQLAPRMIKAVYANVSLLTEDGGLERLIQIADTTEINAIVIDVKEGAVFYDSEVSFFEDAGSVRPQYDLDAILAELAEHDIYAIARMVVFQDPLVAEARPDLAVKDVNGGLWVNEQGVAWVSAFNEELWDANIALGVELVERGFDEIQYDYVRFPSDGDLSTADFGPEYTAENREAAITGFMERSHDAINAAGGFLAADLFGFVTIVDDEQYIGQRFSALEPHLDFVCMMIYPSHFETGNIASAPGHPNDYPYETIYESLERAEANAPGSSAKFRPWLQDFSYGFNGLRDYTTADVRAQIDAAEDFGASGWMLWGDPFNITVDALTEEPRA